MLKERPRFHKIDRWALRVLTEAGAIHECADHGFAKDRGDPDAYRRALLMAEESRPNDLSPEEGRRIIENVLDSVGDCCPECPEILN